MPRTRALKHSFFTNDGLAEIEPLGRLLFAGLWTIADAAGRLPYRPKRIKAQVLPYDVCDVADLVDQLERHGFVRRYTVEGESYLLIVKFTEHQRPHHNEPVHCPDPESGVTTPIAALPEKNQALPEKNQASSHLLTDYCSLSPVDVVPRAPTRTRESDDVVDVSGNGHPYLEDLFDDDDPGDTAAVEIARTLGIRGYVNAERGLADTLRQFADEPDLVGQARQWAAKFGDDTTRSAGQRQQSFKLWLERERQTRLHPQARGSPNGHKPEAALRTLTPEDIAAAEIRFGHSDS